MKITNIIEKTNGKTLAEKSQSVESENLISESFQENDNMSEDFDFEEGR